MQYQLLDNSSAILREDGTIIPADPQNADYAAYLAWTEAGGEPAPAPFADKKAAAILRIDADADAIRRAVVGERATEYQLAYDESAKFKAAGYVGTVPPTVQSWVDAKAAGGVMWTAQQAADDILLTAAQWTGAQNSIRANRLKAKEQARVAGDAAGVESVLASWAAYVTAIRQQLGV